MVQGTTRVLVDCRWLGDTGIGRATEVLLRALATDPPPGRWLLWGPPGTEEFVFSGAEVVEFVGEARTWAGQRSLLARPKHDVAIYPTLLRPPGRRPAVQYLHDVTPIRHASSLHERALRWMYFWTLARAKVLVVGSEAAAEDLHQTLHIRRSRLHVFRYPAPDLLGATRRPCGSNGSQSPIGVLFVGRDTPHKNLERLVAAQRRGGVLPLTLVGPGTEARSDPAHRITGHGEVSAERLGEMYGAARALILPSLSEGLGLTILEAQAAGLPVLASDRPPMNTLLDAAWDISFDPTDIAAMAAALARVEQLPQPGPRTVAGATLEEHRAFIVSAVCEALA